MINMVFRSLLLTMFFMLSQIYCKEEDLKKKADDLFPNRTQEYVQDDLNKAFYPILHQDIKALFDEFFSTLFQKDFPQPKHANSVIAGGYRCLYIKMVTANTEPSPDKTKEEQLFALHQLMYIHRKSLGIKNPELVSQIPPTVQACAKCVMEASSYDQHPQDEGSKLP